MKKILERQKQQSRIKNKFNPDIWMNLVGHVIKFYKLQRTLWKI